MVTTTLHKLLYPFDIKQANKDVPAKTTERKEQSPRQQLVSLRDKLEANSSSSRN